MIRTRFAPLALAILALTACNKTGDSSSGSGAAAKAIAPPAGTKWTDRVEATPEGGVRMGNPDAPVKLIEYGSLSCPHCAKLAEQGFAKLTGEYVASGRMSYEFRSTTIHPQFDVPLTLLARCAPLPAFFPLIEQIYRNFDAMQAPLSDPAVQQKANAAIQGPADDRLVGLADALKYTEFFSARGLPTEAAHACLKDSAKMKELDALAQKYTADGVDSTPTLIVNGEKVGTTDWADLDTALKQAGVR